MFATRTDQKRKFLSPAYNKKRGFTIDHENLHVHMNKDEKSPTEESHARQKVKKDSRTNERLGPISSNKLNTMPFAGKRTASQAALDTESPKAKKPLLSMGNTASARQGSPTLLGRSIVEKKGVSAVISQCDVENVDREAPEKSEDLFDSDDSWLEECLELEQMQQDAASPRNQRPVLSTHGKQPEPVLAYESAIRTELVYANQELPTPTANRKRLFEPASAGTTWSTASGPDAEKPDPVPMKPFMRPFVPLQMTHDASPSSSVVSPIYRSPICFRIGEAMRHISHVFFSPGIRKAKSLDVEIYARVAATSELDGWRTVTLADIFYSRTPPYIMATAESHKMAKISGRHDSPWTVLSPCEIRNALFRAVVNVAPNTGVSEQPIPLSPQSPGTHPLLAGRYTVTLLKMQKADWVEIQRIKDILDEKTESVAAASQTDISPTTKERSPATSMRTPD
jgi:hypothetical protein